MQNAERNPHLERVEQLIAEMLVVVVANGLAMIFSQNVEHPFYDFLNTAQVEGDDDDMRSVLTHILMIISLLLGKRVSDQGEIC